MDRQERSSMYDVVIAESVRDVDRPLDDEPVTKRTSMYDVVAENDRVGDLPLDDEHVALLKVAVQELLDLCAENEVNVPDSLREKLWMSLDEKFVSKRAPTEKTHTEYLTELQLEGDQSFQQSGPFQDVLERLRKVKLNVPPIDLRIKDGSYKVTQYITEDPFEKIHASLHASTHGEDKLEGSQHDGPKRATQKIKTVSSESPFMKICTCLATCLVQKGNMKKRTKIKTIMDGVNLYFESGKMYLVLGGPGSGKSTLMKMIANNLIVNKDCHFDGEVTLSGLSPKDKKIYWTNLVSYIDQIDRLHPFLTVYETLMFSWMCRSGGTHYLPYYGQGSEVMEEVAKMDKEFYMINVILQLLGLKRVENTFVGDKTNVRGVSGGEKKRVTVAEMFTTRTPVLCGDEISTGLDAATTYDITRYVRLGARLTKTVKIVSLLQPPPETVANFDELILISEGKVIYAGPIEDVEKYFNSLGYYIPERVDLADWLQSVPTAEGWRYQKKDNFNGMNDDSYDAELMEMLSDDDLRKRHLSSGEFHTKFYESERGKQILEKVNAPFLEPAETTRVCASHRYRNDGITSFKLVAKRELLLYWRNKYQIKAKIMQTLITGTVVGTLFFNAKTQSVVSVLFLVMFTTGVQAMTQLVQMFYFRSIFYKHQDANFFPTWCYVAGRAMATIPNALIDALLYGTMIYFLVGLAYNDGASIANYFVFLLLIFITSFGSILIFSVFAACVSSVDVAQALMAVSLLLFNVFSGFTVQPDAIPDYYKWFYYINYFAWMFRAFMVNQFQSGKYDEVTATGVTQGEAILIQFGFVDRDNEPYTFPWAWWGMLFTLLCVLLSIIAQFTLFNTIRFTTGKSLVEELGDEFVEEIPESEMVQIPFTRVDLTFKDIHYTVTSSITNEKLELLKGIDGIVEAGKMTALMGSSGAGKTTIMDVIAMRKNTGEITGEIRLNGHLQEEVSFRRCMGYVEQFDQQSPQLTIKETCEFSAKLRLDSKNPAVTPENTFKFVQQALNMLELTNIQDLQVGSDAEGGLSFEQRKRLSIAVELVSNPSILFLDEPTSGLDARAAAIVVRGLKRVAASGRAVCATIHQPSVAVFSEFDRLLLLKRGGEVTFFGDLGPKASLLIEYFERYDSTPKIQPGENPATWMLTTIGAGNVSDKKPFDYAGSYSQSKLCLYCRQQIDAIAANATEDKRVSFESRYATSWISQSKAVMSRTMKIYFRSPSYNVTRVTVSCIIALVFATVYANQRVPHNEGQLNSRINSIFMAVLFICVNAQNTVLALFECERNMFYRHKAANMYDSSAIVLAFTLAELPFLLAVTTFFSVIFYFILGFAMDAGKFFIFFAFVFMGVTTFTFLGQMLVATFRDSATAQGFGGLVVSFTSLFSGVLIRPEQIPNFWIFMYWITPGHYIFESLYTSQFSDDQSEIVASVGSPFYYSLGCSPDTTATCSGTVSQWMAVNFADFSSDSTGWNALFLICFIVFVRLITFYSLTSIDHSSN